MCDSDAISGARVYVSMATTAMEVAIVEMREGSAAKKSHMASVI